MMLRITGAFHDLIESEHGLQVFVLSRFRTAKPLPLLLETL
jgi:hypothetical protein